jgi:hypothetical protein
VASDVKQIDNVSDRPITLWLDGQEMKLGKLRAPDFAVAADYVRTIRTRQYQQTVTAEPGMADIYAKAIAAIQCTPVTIADCLDDWNGRIKLVQLALMRANVRMTEAQVAERLEHDRGEFFFVLCELSGMKRKEQNENPTPAAAKN